MKLFKVAGVSLHKGKYAVRYANSASRAGVLAKNGHQAVNLYVFPEALAKEDVVDELLNPAYGWNELELAAIQKEAAKLGFIL